MSRILLISLLILGNSTFCNAQYYYKDILSSIKTTNELIKYKSENISKIIITSYEADGAVVNDFFCEKKISKDYKKTTLNTRSPELKKSSLETYFDEKNKIIKTHDSTDEISGTTQFAYDNQERLISTTTHSISRDDDFINESIEEHLYFYNTERLPVKLALVKNKKDTTIILFSTDEKGNITIEKNTRSAFKYYYYYDDSNRVTDIVHVSEYKSNPSPDYIFEYNDKGDIIQMITASEQKGSSILWKYDYENGLRTKERLFSSSRKYLGKMEYEYRHF